MAALQGSLAQGKTSAQQQATSKAKLQAATPPFSRKPCDEIYAPTVTLTSSPAADG